LTRKFFAPTTSNSILSMSFEVITKSISDFINNLWL